jgi:hypothetical protein|tara:strand:- start:36 stop:182 length:147 start_codon:yes stop_codon:yes gene_type:complete
LVSKNEIAWFNAPAMQADTVWTPNLCVDGVRDGAAASIATIGAMIGAG